MANTHITVNQYEDLLKRIEKVEHSHKGIEIPVDELKEKYHEIDKEQVTILGKIDLLGEKIVSLDTKFDTKFNSLEKRINMQWALQIMTFLAILGLYFKIFNVI